MIKSLSVVIPAFNEEKRIGRTLTRIDSYLRKKGFDYEIIVVDDCSKDKTLKVASKTKGVSIIKNSKNLGKGGSVKQGMLASTKKWILFSDADLSTPIEMLDRMIRFAGKYDIIIGSRNLEDSDIELKQPWYRVMAGKAFPLMVRMLLVSGIKDTQCGFKMFRKDVVATLFKKQRLNGWAFDAEILYIAKKKSLRIKEIGVVWKNDPNSKVSLFKDSIRMGKDIFKIRLNSLKGRY